MGGGNPYFRFGGAMWIKKELIHHQHLSSCIVCRCLAGLSSIINSIKGFLLPLSPPRVSHNYNSKIDYSRHHQYFDILCTRRSSASDFSTNSKPRQSKCCRRLWFSGTIVNREKIILQRSVEKCNVNNYSKPFNGYVHQSTMSMRNKMNLRRSSDSVINGGIFMADGPYNNNTRLFITASSDILIKGNHSISTHSLVSSSFATSTTQSSKTSILSRSSSNLSRGWLEKKGLRKLSTTFSENQKVKGKKFKDTLNKPGKLALVSDKSSVLGCKLTDNPKCKLKKVSNSILSVSANSKDGTKKLQSDKPKRSLNLNFRSSDKSKDKIKGSSQDAKQSKTSILSSFKKTKLKSKRGDFRRFTTSVLPTHIMSFVRSSVELKSMKSGNETADIVKRNSVPSCINFQTNIPLICEPNKSSSVSKKRHSSVQYILNLPINQNSNRLEVPNKQKENKKSPPHYHTDSCNCSKMCCYKHMCELPCKDCGHQNLPLKPCFSTPPLGAKSCSRSLFSNPIPALEALKSQSARYLRSPKLGICKDKSPLCSSTSLLSFKQTTSPISAKKPVTEKSSISSYPNGQFRLWCDSSVNSVDYYTCDRRTLTPQSSLNSSSPLDSPRTPSGSWGHIPWITTPIKNNNGSLGTRSECGVPRSQSLSSRDTQSTIYGSSILYRDKENEVRLLIFMENLAIYSNNDV